VYAPTPKTTSAILIAFAAVGIISAQLAAQSQSAPFDYYVLSLSWAPSYCGQPSNANRSPEECAVGRHVGFIVHGLWPQSTNGKSPENCGGSRNLPNAVVNYAKALFLSYTLIQHEWTTHGTCTGLAPFDYFTQVSMARAAVQIPVQITSIEKPTSESPGQIETQFATANSDFPKEAFRTHCSSRTFEEVRVCFDKNIHPQACTATAGECRNPSVTIPPPL
jgi:ribonuclease T2